MTIIVGSNMLKKVLIGLLILGVARYGSALDIDYPSIVEHANRLNNALANKNGPQLMAAVRDIVKSLPASTLNLSALTSKPGPFA